MNTLSLHGVSVAFDEIPVLSEINLTIRRGEIHALLGEHGSGKSTLCKVISGFMQPDRGEIGIDGRRFAGLTARQAQARGIRLISQENPMFENMSVAANLFLNNRSVFSSPFTTRRRLHREAREYLASWDMTLDPREKLSSLHIGDKIILNVLKNLHYSPSLLILDESFERLTTTYLQKLKQLLLSMNEQGMSLLYVTHKVDDLFDFAHHVTILREGSILYRDSIKESDAIDLIRLAYTQISKEEASENPGQEFYALLKYNRAILEELPVSLLVVDEGYKLKIINDSAKSLFGVEERRYFNRSWEILPLMNGDELFPVLEEAVSAQESRSFHDLALEFEDRLVEVDVNVFPIFDGRHFIGSIIVFADITEQEQMRGKIMLAEKLASVGLLSAGVAHEINNPLEIIYNYLDHIRIKSGGNPEMEEAVRGIEAEIESISQITSNLILFGESRVEETEILELHELLLTILDLVRRTAAGKGIEIVAQPVEQPLYCSANRNELKQVILNLLKNAFEAMPAGGRLTVRTELEELGSRRRIRLIVRDTGTGISVRNREDLFLPFFTTKDEREENLGLGLAISYSLVRRYNGNIEVSSPPEGGAEFVVLLPVAEGGAELPRSS